MAKPDVDGDLDAAMAAMGRAARDAARITAEASGRVRANAIKEAADAILASERAILAANAEDMKEGRAAGLSAALLDRLQLDSSRLASLAEGLRQVAVMKDVVGVVLASWKRPNGLEIERVRVPIGVIGVIYESRPAVTADAAALCLKAGNAVILRCGSESLRSSRAIADAFSCGLARAGLPQTAVQLVATSSRRAVGLMLRMAGVIDVLIPRGGKSLIARVMEESRIPVLCHLEGVCHTYIHKSADRDMARRVALNAKMRRPGICGATETILVDRDAVAGHIPPLLDDLLSAGCEIRGDAAIRALRPQVKAATSEDWGREYLDAVVAVRVVEGLEEAIAAIARYGSGHTDAILAEDTTAIARFFKAVDSGIVMCNASTQFADGGEFGMGAEIGISTNRLHARGPVGAEQLTSYKYLVRGCGHTRP